MPMDKSPEAFRTISEVSEALETPAHVLRFWESRFPQIRPVKRAGGRRYYRPADVALLTGIRDLLHVQGLTILGVQKILREQGVRHVASLAEGDVGAFDAEADDLIEGQAVDADVAPEPAEMALVIALEAAHKRRLVAETPAAAVQDRPSATVLTPFAAPESAAPEMIPEAPLERDEEKWNPALLNDHATTKNRDQDDGSIKHHPDLVWAVAEPEFALPLPTPLHPQADGPLNSMNEPGLATRLRALPRPLSETALSALAELHNRLGLLHAQMAEAVRLQR